MGRMMSLGRALRRCVSGAFCSAPASALVWDARGGHLALVCWASHTFSSRLFPARAFISNAAQALRNLNAAAHAAFDATPHSVDELIDMTEEEAYVKPITAADLLRQMVRSHDASLAAVLNDYTLEDGGVKAGGARTLGAQRAAAARAPSSGAAADPNASPGAAFLKHLKEDHLAGSSGSAATTTPVKEVSLFCCGIYRYKLCESCSRFDLLPLIYLIVRRVRSGRRRRTRRRS